MSFLLITVFSKSMHAQEAENLFKTYKKWGVTTQFNMFSESTSSPRASNKAYNILERNFNPALGVSYNFLQFTNWNFKLEAQLQWVGSREKLFIDSSETILPNNWEVQTITNSEMILYIPLTVEYYKRLSNKTNIYFGAGVGITYYKYNDYSDGYFKVDNVEVFNNSDVGNGSRNLFFSAHLELGATIKFEKFMLQPYITYKKSFQNFIKGEFEFKNLNTLPDQKYKLNLSGDYIGVGMRAYLKKETKLFKKKN
jgi:hypothetical protein